MKLYSNIVQILLIWVVSIFFISFFGFISFPHSGKFSDDFLQSFRNWDGGHFTGIAESGYKEKFQYAFFPLYPLLIRFFGGILGNYFLAAIAISILSTFLAMQFLYRLIILDFEKKIAQKTIFAMLFFPASFFFLTAYSEALFFFLTVAAFYFLKKRNLLIVTIFAIFAGATRFAGVSLAIALIVYVQATVGFNRKNWFVIFAPMGFLLYCFYLFYHTGDPFFFIAAENHWQRNIAFPGLSFWDGIKSITLRGITAANFTILLDLIFATFGLGLALRTLRFLPVEYSIYTLLSVLVPIFTSTLTSIPRFLLPIFPIFIMIALIKNNLIQVAYQIVSLMLLAAYTILFINGYWVS